MSTKWVRQQVDLARSRLGVPRGADVRSVLGSDHPLTGSTELAKTLAAQAITTAGAAGIGAVAVTARLSWGAAVFRVATIVELLLVVGLAVTLRRRRADILRLIGGGEEHLALEEVVCEARHLASRAHLMDLADRLELTLEHARAWHPAADAARPEEGVLLLGSFGTAIDEIVRLLRDSAPPAQGAALLELLLIRVYNSNLLVGELELEQELWRIRYLLSAGGGREPDRSVLSTAQGLTPSTAPNGSGQHRG